MSTQQTVVLVTGGYGFIGSNFIRLLASDSKYKVVNVDKITYAADVRNLEGIEIKSYHTDITSKSGIDKLFWDASPEVVVNFAAETHVDNSIKDPSRFANTNFMGTMNLLNASFKHGVKKFIQISTDEVYGSIGLGKFTEESPIDPSSPYSASKAGADHLALSFFKTFGMPVCVTRCSNNYGPRQHKEKLIPCMINKALKDEPLPVYGDGLNVRDWIHVEDHCKAVLAVMEKGKAGEVYNIGSSNEHTNIEIVKTILQQLGKPESLIKFVEDRKGHDRRYAIDNTKIYEKLGWKATTPFAKGIKDTINFYKKSVELIAELSDIA